MSELSLEGLVESLLFLMNKYKQEDDDTSNVR
jgi:hypothetical protein